MRHVMVTLAVHREGEHYVADRLELGTSSFGATEKEALDNVRETTLLYLSTLDDLDECDVPSATPSARDSVPRGTRR